MRSFIKKHQQIFIALIFSAIFSFMLFIVEPTTMYAGNSDDLWFDYYLLMGPSILLFFLCFAALFIFLCIIHAISSRIKNPKLFQFTYLFLSFCFICAYIQSNFLSSFLPPLDGSEPNWGEFLPNLISIVLLLFVAGSIIFLCIKFTIEKTIHYVFYVSLAVFAMLFTSLFTTFLTTSIFEPKGNIPVATIDNINLVSTNRNFLILLVDAVDSTHFNNVIKENPDYKSILSDFTYFPDTLSGYSFTRDSIPFILSGVWNENTKPFNQYSTEAYDNSKFFSALSAENYNKNFYEYSFVWQSRKAFEFENVVPVSDGVKTGFFIKQELKYILFKTLPHPLKRFTKIETLDFTPAQNDPPTTPAFFWSDTDYYHNTLKEPLSFTDEKYFQFIHLEGAHTPFTLSKDLEEADSEIYTYYDKLEATAKIIRAYIERLKTNHVYDNSTIVIMADHGFWYEKTGRQNPILYIKGVNEHHHEMQISEKQVSYADLCDTFIELLNDKKSTELFSDLPTNGRLRRYIDNLFNHEEHMTEYETTDKAWIKDGLKATGEEYDL